VLTKLDGVLLAVRDAGAASETFARLFGAEVTDKVTANAINAEVTDLAFGSDRIGLAVPTGPGPIADHLDRWGEGIVGVAFATQDVQGLKDRIAGKGVSVDHSLIDPAATHGLMTWIVPHVERDRVGVPSFIYEVTHLVEDWKSVSDFWTDIFGLDGAKFSPISSDQYGYEGMLTLIEPPRLLDRIEVVHPHDRSKAMGKFFDKRGEGPYMFFTECEDMAGLVDRLESAGARYAPDRTDGAPRSLFVHPSSTHGVLIGVSGKNVAWVWSGRPELARSND
jgi:catechol 2,3-dioxygenase-like lactoylglutathione lyase family enzyme